MNMTEYNANGWYPQSGYDQQVHALRRDSNFVGIIVLCQTVLLQVVFLALFYGFAALGIIKSSADQYYGLGNIGFLLFYSLSYIIGVGLPAPIAAVIARRHIRPFSRLENFRDKDHIEFPTIILALMGGMALCIIANFVSSYIVYLFSEFGLYPPDMPAYMEKNIGSLLMNILVFALLPAILEEMIYRGYILRILSKYGNVFAVVVSSVLFALMHGNILQIPFAFIVGLTCGYIVIKTGRIWISMMIHFLNNFMSELLQYVGLFSSTEEYQKTVTLVFSLIGMLGLFAILILFAIGSPIIRRNEPQAMQMSTAKRTGNLLIAPAMIICLIVAIVLTVFTTQWGGAA